MKKRSARWPWWDNVLRPYQISAIRASVADALCMGWLVWRARIPFRVRLPPHIDFPCTPNSPNIISRSASVALHLPHLWERALLHCGLDA